MSSEHLGIPQKENLDVIVFILLCIAAGRQYLGKRFQLTPISSGNVGLGGWEVGLLTELCSTKSIC